MKTEISFEEKKRIQLEMLDEIDAFCRGNDIRYSIAFGTLLGAIRHHGFIPWDDDVDIMMPLPDLLKFKKLFKSEKLRYLDVDTEPKFEFPFSRIARRDTYNKVGWVGKEYGINIDVYVLIGLPQDTSSFFDDLQVLYKRRHTLNVWRNRFARYLGLGYIPYYNKLQKKYRDCLFYNSAEYGSTSLYYVIAGPLNLKNKMIYEKDIFHSLSPVQFEDREYMAIDAWDYFLTLRYGDYMKLPPEDQRRPYHGGHYYWK